MGAFEEYQKAMQTYAERVRAVSEDINTNRAKYQEVVAKFEAAVLADKETKLLEEEMAGINAQFEILNHKADALNKGAARGANSFLKTAAVKVIQENKAAIENLRVKWNEKRKIVQDLQTQYLKALCDLGALARESSFLREQCNLAAADAGTNAHVAALGDSLDIARRRGFVFIPEKAIALAYTSGEMPPGNPDFQGVVTGTPRAKIRTDAPEDLDPDSIKYEFDPDMEESPAS